MSYLQVEFNFEIPAAAKEAFIQEVKEIFSAIMDTGKDHIGLSLRCFRQGDLSFGQGDGAGERVAFVNADIHRGRTSDQKRRLSQALIEDLHRRWQVPRRNIYVILTEHPEEDFQFQDLAGPH